MEAPLSSFPSHINSISSLLDKKHKREFRNTPRPSKRFRFEISLVALCFFCMPFGIKWWQLDCSTFHFKLRPLSLVGYICGCTVWFIRLSKRYPTRSLPRKTWVVTVIREPFIFSVSHLRKEEILETDFTALLCFPQSFGLIWEIWQKCQVPISRKPRVLS